MISRKKGLAPLLRGQETRKSITTNLKTKKDIVMHYRAIIIPATIGKVLKRNAAN